MAIQEQEAKVVALQLAIALINLEITSPSDLSDSIEDNESYRLVRRELVKIEDRLVTQLQKLESKIGARS